MMHFVDISIIILNLQLRCCDKRLNDVINLLNYFTVSNFMYIDAYMQLWSIICARPKIASASEVLGAFGEARGQRSDICASRGAGRLP